MTGRTRAAGVSLPSVRHFERGDTMKATTVDAVQRALEKGQRHLD
jgi:hypothetical protein